MLVNRPDHEAYKLEMLDGQKLNENWKPLTMSNKT